MYPGEIMHVIFIQWHLVFGRRSGEIYGNNRANQQQGKIDPIKNRALNRVPLKWLSGPERNGHSSAGRARRGHAAFTTLPFRWDKVTCTVTQPVLTIAFFLWYLIPCLPPAPPYHYSSGDTLTGHVWEGGKMDERARGQTPGLHISTVSKCLWQLCVSSSPDAAFPVNCTNLGPPSLTCMGWFIVLWNCTT